VDAWLDQHIITPQFFSMTVLMAIATTLMTVPGLTLVKLTAAGDGARGRFQAIV